MNRKVPPPPPPGPEKGVVDGVEKAVGKMKKGETARLTLRPDYAYGEAGHSKLGVPPNTEVTFVVTLVDFEKVSHDRLGGASCTAQTTAVLYVTILPITITRAQ